VITDHRIKDLETKLVEQQEVIDFMCKGLKKRGINIFETEDAHEERSESSGEEEEEGKDDTSNLYYYS